ncbi:MAG: ABC transporter substrate-binding protein [Proteobacteria bacterium]|nr:ABC transporter substrate-binding protein [Pseudomonadota bacterium]MBU1451482.1 ABC transporter substrate-binding protein [Pseudomonadota bacterium]MBU2470483.1 ABC transporter substrate-binding protein [Pseudomonadota bacterium]MBU2516391.1 ABC transporter substrate-binding protein [Pseudomonadota bacterium]
MGALLCSALALALLLAPPAASAAEVIKIGGPAVEGMFLTTHFDEEGVTTPAGRRYAAEYRRKFAKAPDALWALGYDAYNVVLDAIATIKQGRFKYVTTVKP